MKKLLILILLVGCKSTLTIEVSNCFTNTSKVVKVKARKSICIASFDDSIERLVDFRNRILVDSVCDYKILSVKK